MLVNSDGIVIDSAVPSGYLVDMPSVIGTNCKALVEPSSYKRIMTGIHTAIKTEEWQTVPYTLIKGDHCICIIGPFDDDVAIIHRAMIRPGESIYNLVRMLRMASGYLYNKYYRLETG